MHTMAEQFRRKAGAKVIDGFFRGMSRLGAAHPKARPEAHGVRVVRDLPYRDSPLREHRLDVYLPPGQATGRKVVLYVHGGGFRILSKETHWLMGLAFARQGYVVFNISYRLAPEHPFPAALEDCVAALGWVKEHAAEWGGDATQIVFAGESAGANLVTSLALACCARRDEAFAREAFALGVRPSAVIAACGMLQVSDIARFSRRKPGFPRFLEDRLEEVSRGYVGAIDVCTEAQALADPLCLVEELARQGAGTERPLPPFFLPVGTRDPLLDDTRRLARALGTLGVPAEDRYYPGEVHAFHAFVFRAQARRCWEDTFAFLARHAPASAD